MLSIRFLILDVRFLYLQVKNRKLKIIPYLFTCAIFIVCLASPAIGRSVGTSGSAALEIGIGSRATSMGEACVAVVNDVSSVYWNPAGLFYIQGSQLSAMHIEWLDDIRYEWIGYAQPLTSWATVAADVSYVHMGDMVRTIESPTEGYEENGTFTSSDVAGRISFASKTFRGLLVGVSVQMFQSRVDFADMTKERIGDKVAKSTAIGLGCLYDTRIPNLTVGCSVQNWGRQTQAFISKKEPLPFSFRLGVGYETLVSGWKPQTPEEEVPEEGAEPDASLDKAPGLLVAAMDLDIPVDDSPSVHMGLEYQFRNGIAFRAGYRTGTGFSFPGGFSGGIGYITNTYQIDYSLVPYGDIGSTHRASFTIKF